MDQLVNMGSITKIVTLEQELWEMALRTRILEDTLKKALAFILELSEYVSKLPGLGTPVPMGGISQEDYRALKASQMQAIDSIRQELKGGGIELGGFAFDGEDAYIAFAREHFTTDPTYHCIPSLMFALCMPLDEVIYKSDMQGDEIHAARMAQNPMQSAVMLSVNTIIPPILEGLKDGIWELKLNFNAARTYKEWLPANSHGGTCKILMDGVKCASKRIKGAIQITLGPPLAKNVMMELHGEFLMHFNAIFITNVSNFYLDILGKAGGTPLFLRRSRPPVGHWSPSFSASCSRRSTVFACMWQAWKIYKMTQLGSTSCTSMPRWRNYECSASLHCMNIGNISSSTILS